MAVIVSFPTENFWWNKTTASSITWNPNSFGEEESSVNIDLYLNDVNTYSIVSNFNNTGSYSWTPGTGITSNINYKIRVYGIVSNSFGFSALFIIGSSALTSFTETISFSDPSSTDITVTSPSAGAKWNRDESQTITWDSSSLAIPTHPVSIYLDSITSENIATIVSNTGNTGSYSWTPSGSTSITSTELLIRIKDSITSEYGYSGIFNIYSITSTSFTEAIGLADSFSEGIISTKIIIDSLKISDSANFYFSNEVLKATSFEDRSSLSYNIKFYIKDQNDAWVDFTNRLTRKSKYRLTDISTITHSTESKSIGGIFLSSISDVTMENSDGFWDDPSQWADLKTTMNTPANFSVSKNGGEIILAKNKCKVVVETIMKDGSILEEPVGVFRIRGFTTDSTSGIATLEIVSLAQYLKDAKADRCRNGRSWYMNRSISFLVRKLLELEFGNKDTGELPASFRLPTKIVISTFDNERELSSFGRPPERTIT